jgi:hypothetical protein
MRDKVKAPAIALIITGAVGIAFAILGAVWNVVGGSEYQEMVDLGVSPGIARAMTQPGIYVGVGLLQIAACAFVLWAGMQMRNLRGRVPAMAASIAVMVPIILMPCCLCLAGIPIGIWSLVVLSKPEVRAAFEGGTPPNDPLAP